MVKKWSSTPGQYCEIWTLPQKYTKKMVVDFAVAKNMVVDSMYFDTTLPGHGLWELFL